MEPLPPLSSLDKQQLQDLLRQLYDKACLLFGEAFDAELTVKVRLAVSCNNNFHPTVSEAGYGNTTTTGGGESVFEVDLCRQTPIEIVRQMETLSIINETIFPGK